MIYITVNLCFWLVPLIPLALLKIIIPFRRVQDVITRLMVWIYGLAVWCDDVLFFGIMGIRLDISGLRRAYRDTFYIIIANHQSWNDIFILQHLFNWRAPVLKFLVKRELIYLPVVGIICWAYNYPFLRRRSVKGAKGLPGKGDRDLEVLEKALSRFSRYPASVINLVEGSRFSPAKAEKQKSGYNHLLKPKAGGLTTMLNFLEGRVSNILDVTIVYGCKKPTFWNFLCKRCPRVLVKIQEHSVLGMPRDYDALANWIKGVWQKKDQEIEEMRKSLV